MVASREAARLLRSSRAAIHTAAYVLGGVTLVTAPWAVRNAVELGRPVVTTTHGGYTLALANNPVFYREVVDGPPGAAWEGGSLDAWQRSLDAAMAADGVPATEPARDRWLKARAWRTIRERPAEFLRAVGYRLARFWGIGPIGPAAEGRASSVLWAVRGFYAATFLLAGCGLLRTALDSLRSRGRRRRRWRPAALLILAFCGVHALYWTDARMRAPLVPAIAVFAALGAQAVLRAVPGRQKRRNS